jgi:antirestriction protein ArdC
MQFIYQKITDLILEKLEQGVVPWQKTWKSAAFPKNFVSGLEYKGINLMLLGMQDFGSNQWITFRQCKELGGSIKKDEHSSPVVFWKTVVKINSKPLDDSTADIFFLLRYYNVFNLDQCVLPEEVLKKRNTMPTNTKIIKAEQVIEGYKNRPEICTNNMIPAPRYLPTLDRVEIQSIDAYNTSND